MTRGRAMRSRSVRNGCRKQTEARGLRVSVNLRFWEAEGLIPYSSGPRRSPGFEGRMRGCGFSGLPQPSRPQRTVRRLDVPEPFPQGFIHPGLPSRDLRYSATISGTNSDAGRIVAKSSSVSSGISTASQPSCAMWTFFIPEHNGHRMISFGLRFVMERPGFRLPSFLPIWLGSITSTNVPNTLTVPAKESGRHLNFRKSGRDSWRSRQTPSLRDGAMGHFGDLT